MEGMRSVGDILQGMLAGIDPQSKLYESLQKAQQLTPEQRTRRMVDSYNAQSGKLDEITNGYSCSKCKNRGDIAVLEERNGAFYEAHTQCECMKIRRSIWRIMESGLAKSMKEQTFKTFTVKAQWQQTMIDTAKAYVAEGVSAGAWFYAGGQIGAGKTHICTGIARELLYGGKELRYVIWEEMSKKLKALMTEPEYADEMKKIQTVEVLYIDDLFKPTTDESGAQRPPSGADIKLAFELLNYRYVNRLPTILSSERYQNELLELDEAVGSRIYERSKGYCLNIGRDTSKNHRLDSVELI